MVEENVLIPKNNIYSETNKVSWSMDDAQNEKISKYLDDALTCHRKFDYSGMVGALQTASGVFIHSLNSDERDKLKEMDKKIGMYIYTWNMEMAKRNPNIHYSYGGECPEEIREKLNEVIQKYPSGMLRGKAEDYQEVIMDLLDKYGYLSKLKKDKTEMRA